MRCEGLHGLGGQLLRVTRFAAREGVLLAYSSEWSRSRVGMLKEQARPAFAHLVHGAGY